MLTLLTIWEEKPSNKKSWLSIWIVIRCYQIIFMVFIRNNAFLSKTMKLFTGFRCTLYIRVWNALSSETPWASHTHIIVVKFKKKKSKPTGWDNVESLDCIVVELLLSSCSPFPPKRATIRGENKEQEKLPSNVSRKSLRMIHAIYMITASLRWKWNWIGLINVVRGT